MARLCLCALTVAFGVLAFAAAPPHLVPAEVRRLIDDLGSDDEDVRKVAVRKLGAASEAALPALRQAARSHGDADIRLRDAVVVRTRQREDAGPSLPVAGRR